MADFKKVKKKWLRHNIKFKLTFVSLFLLSMSVLAQTDCKNLLSVTQHPDSTVHVVSQSVTIKGMHVRFETFTGPKINENLLYFGMTSESKKQPAGPGAFFKFEDGQSIYFNSKKGMIHKIKAARKTYLIQGVVEISNEEIKILSSKKIVRAGINDESHATTAYSARTLNRILLCLVDQQ